MKNIAILFAMQAEAQPLIDACGLQENCNVLDPRLPLRLFSTRENQSPFSVIVSGQDTRFNVDWIGLEMASLMAYSALRDCSADLLISAGTAGGFAHLGAQIASVYLSNGNFYYHDHHVPLPGFEHSQRGAFPSHDVRCLATQLELPTGPMSSGSSLSNSERDMAFINAHNIVAKDMEMAAIAQVAYLMRTPMFAIKAITNLIDTEQKSSAQQFQENFTHANKALHVQLQRLLGVLLMKKTSR